MYTVKHLSTGETFGTFHHPADALNQAMRAWFTRGTLWAEFLVITDDSPGADIPILAQGQQIPVVAARYYLPSPKSVRKLASAGTGKQRKRAAKRDRRRVLTSPPEPFTEYMHPREAARMLDVSESEMRDLVTARNLECKHVGQTTWVSVVQVLAIREERDAA